MFAVPLVLTLGTGLGVAYHDGVMAADVTELSQEDVGSKVTVKGVVLWSDADCDHGDEELAKDVACFVLRDTHDENRFIMVSTTEDAPKTDTTIVARGDLVFYWDMGDWEGWDWSGGWGDYGDWGSSLSTWRGPAGPSAHDDGTGGNWQDLKIAWVDATGIAEPWLFK